jgi:hypothetical protein
LLQRGPDGLTLTALGERVCTLVEGMERTAGAVQKFVIAQQGSVRLAVIAGR